VVGDCLPTVDELLGNDSFLSCHVRHYPLTKIRCRTKRPVCISSIMNAAKSARLIVDSNPIRARNRSALDLAAANPLVAAVSR
jgi:hypothetical protein